MRHTVLGALLAASLAAPEGSGHRRIREPKARKVRGPRNRSQENERRRRQIERGIIRPTDAEKVGGRRT